MNESPIRTSIRKLLERYEARDHLYFIKNNTGAIKQTYKGRTRWFTYGKTGSSDFLIWFKGGHAIFLEVKTSDKKSKQSEAQIAFQAKVELLGFKYYIVRSASEALDVLSIYIK